MINIRFATVEDIKYWQELDSHISVNELKLKIRDNRAYIILQDSNIVGVMRYNLFWDSIPFLTMINLSDKMQGQGIGKQAMQIWEDDMRNMGFKMLMTSTQVNEGAQHFYRKLGYVEKGALFLDGTPYSQPQEMFLVKVI